MGYLTSLGIDVKDLSDYSRQEVIEAYEACEAVAGESNGLLEDLMPKNTPLPVQPAEPANVTSEQILELTSAMTSQDVIDRLGATQDVGFGLLILRYRVDDAYTLNIPFAGLDAQLGVYGEDLLKALQPIE